MNKQRKLWVFRIIALSIPFFVLVAIELSLRIAGFGQAFPLFIENPVQPDYRLPRPDILKRYFRDDQLPSVKLEANFFLADKPDNGLRLFVQGGSTAAGFPYGMGASIAGMLDHRLKQTYPEHTVEVINTAMSAINSYQLLDTADDIIQQQPDAVLIYAGHNEYLGLFGVGSTFGFSTSLLTRWYFALRDIAIVDAMTKLYQALTPTEATSVTNQQQRRTFMSQVAKNQRIVLNDATYTAGVEQFRNNLDQLLDRYQQANIPVFLATIASNLKDQPPFSAEPLTEQQENALRSDADLLTLSKETLNSGNAQWHYRLATRLFQAGFSEEAKRHFVQAKEFDLLRFRAPEAINKIIRNATLRPNVTLVDAHKALAQRSPSGIIGNNLMLEHLHPNVAGYFIISDAFYQALTNNGPWQPKAPVSTEDAWRLRPLIPAEEYFGFAQIQALLADYPFSDPPTQVTLPKPADWQQQLGHDYVTGALDWLGMMQRSLAMYEQQNDLAMALKVSQVLADALPHDPAINLKAAEYLLNRKRLPEARFYLARAQRSGAILTRFQQRLIKQQ